MHRAYLRGTFALSIALIASSAVGQPASEPLPEASQSTIGYESVAEALKSLRSQRGVVFTTENGWLIATDDAAYTIWSFAPEGYPAYPAAVRRQVVPHGNGSIIQMNVLCEATKEACDALVRTFAEMNSLPLDQ
jgi:hypothetical protein